MRVSNEVYFPVGRSSNWKVNGNERKYLLLTHHKFFHFCKYFWFELREVREHFAVELYVLGFEERDESAVGYLGPEGGVKLYRPEGAHGALLFFSSAERPGKRVKECFFGGALFRFAAPLKTLGGFQDFFALLIGYGASFDSGHGIWVN